MQWPRVCSARALPSPRGLPRPYATSTVQAKSCWVASPRAPMMKAAHRRSRRCRERTRRAPAANSSPELCSALRPSACSSRPRRPPGRRRTRHGRSCRPRPPLERRYMLRHGDRGTSWDPGGRCSPRHQDPRPREVCRLLWRRQPRQLRRRSLDAKAPSHPHCSLSRTTRRLAMAWLLGASSSRPWTSRRCVTKKESASCSALLLRDF
mmetsp:Transcript_75350/g.209382  ORF Transcript_75350/g.209382 Transcript_75350/m.209382 type:complete len:208 (+) Transcript_75350:794-1417(+)